MGVAIPAGYRDLFEKRCVAYLGVVLASGRVLVNPVWCELVGESLHLILAEGGGKARVLQRDPRVTLCVTDPDTPNRYLELRGRVATLGQEGGAVLLARLNRRYEGSTEPVPEGDAPAPGFLRAVMEVDELRPYTAESLQ